MEEKWNFENDYIDGMSQYDKIYKFYNNTSKIMRINE